MTTEKLSNKNYWDQVLKDAKLPLCVSEKQYSTWLIIHFIDSIIKNLNPKTLMEVGAGSSAWLPFFGSKYNLLVAGLDYSEVGCKICEENLKLQSIPYSSIICDDLFNWNSDDKYDVVISNGVIEHFDNPGEVIKKCYSHIHDNGIIISVIPNLTGLYGKLTKKYLEDVYNMHKIITKEELTNYHEECGLKTLKVNYTGIIYPLVIPWNSKVTGYFFKSGTTRKKATIFLINVFNLLFTKFLKICKTTIASPYYSPFIIYVGKKL
jgi:2-polyprenyl-3-methyl-5-hydroxy-6-metoxy-1,4-benzoquinol methylase